MFVERSISYIIRISETPNAPDFACIGVSMTYYRINGEVIKSSFPRKPHAQYTMQDLEDIYKDFLRCREMLASRA